MICKLRLLSQTLYRASLKWEVYDDKCDCKEEKEEKEDYKDV